MYNYQFPTALPSNTMADELSFLSDFTLFDWMSQQDRHLFKLKLL